MSLNKWVILRIFYSSRFSLWKMSWFECLTLSIIFKTILLYRRLLTFNTHLEKCITIIRGLYITRVYKIQKSLSCILFIIIFLFFNIITIFVGLFIKLFMLYFIISKTRDLLLLFLIEWYLIHLCYCFFIEITTF